MLSFFCFFELLCGETLFKGCRMVSGYAKEKVGKVAAAYARI
jgi:hypothetical protein